MQHFAGLLLDYELASHVNLLEDDKVKDVYKNLVKPINKAINIYGLDNSEFYNLTYVKLTRKELKTLIMTKTYNVTTFGMRGQLMDKFDKIDEERVSASNKSYFVSKYRVPSKLPNDEL